MPATPRFAKPNNASSQREPGPCDSADCPCCKARLRESKAALEKITDLKEKVGTLLESINKERGIDIPIKANGLLRETIAIPCMTEDTFRMMQEAIELFRPLIVRERLDSIVASQEMKDSIEAAEQFVADREIATA